ncbi:hypothetical protein [Cyclobacterium xiamenense]|uniref:hypothetical protein n=1 Tax=Cyclobacterium xiamenense TaxID=1297121 RepID=UPI0035D09446
MKKYYIINLIVYIILFTIIIVLVFISYRPIKDNNSNSGLVQNLRVKNVLLREGFFQFIDFSKLSLDFNIDVLNFNNSKINLYDELLNEKTVVLFIYASACMKCNSSNIKKILEFKNKSNLDILIGVDGLDFRAFKSFVKTYNIEEYSFVLPEKYFEGFQYSPVAYFVVSDNLKVCCFYAPSFIFPDLTDDYFSKVESFYGQ